MPNTIPKLAGKFQAWKFTVTVSMEKLLDAFKRCEDMGLDPNRRVWASQDGKISFTVFCPRYKDDSILGKTCEAFRGQMADCGATTQVYVARLICPLPGE